MGDQNHGRRWSPDNTRGTAHRMVLPEARYSQPQHHRSRVHSLLRWSKEPCLGNAILARISVLGYPNTSIVDGFGGCTKSVANEQIPIKELPYRASFPLSATIGATGTDDYTPHPREGQPLGHTHQAIAEPSDRNVEEEMDWLKWICDLDIEAFE